MSKPTVVYSQKPEDSPLRCKLGFHKWKSGPSQGVLWHYAYCKHCKWQRAQAAGFSTFFSIPVSDLPEPNFSERAVQ